VLLFISRDQERTGFRVRLREKLHRYFSELLSEHGVLANQALDLPEELQRQGNCIARAMWHVGPKTKAPGRARSSW
jgi:hypothetical protein